MGTLPTWFRGSIASTKTGFDPTGLDPRVGFWSPEVSTLAKMIYPGDANFSIFSHNIYVLGLLFFVPATVKAE